MPEMIYDASRAAASSIPMQLNGKEYRISPLTDTDIGELDNWIRSRALRMARASLDADTPQAERDELLRAAYSYASGLSWMHPEGAKVMSTFDGIVRLTWQMLKRHHPDLTEQVIREDIFSEHGNDATMAESIDSVMDAFAMLHGGPDDEVGEGAKKKRRPSTGKRSTQRSRKSSAGRRRSSQA